MKWAKIGNDNTTFEISSNNDGFLYQIKWTKCTASPDLIRLLMNLQSVKKFLSGYEMDYFIEKLAPGIFCESLYYSKILIIGSLDKTQNNLYEYCIASKSRMFDQHLLEFANVCWYMKFPIVTYWYKKRYAELKKIKDQVDLDAETYAKYMVEQYKNLVAEIPKTAGIVLLYMDD